MTDFTPHSLRRSLGFWAHFFYGVGDVLEAGTYALVREVVGVVAGSASWSAFDKAHPKRRTPHLAFLIVLAVAIKRRNLELSRTFCAPRAVPISGALICLALMSFVAQASLLTAAVVLALGAGLIGRQSGRAGT